MKRRYKNKKENKIALINKDYFEKNLDHDIALILKHKNIQYD